MRFTINLATRTYLDHRLINRVAFYSIVFLLIILGWNVSRATSILGEQNRLSAEIAAIKGKTEATPNGISVAEFNRQKTRIHFYNEIIERKSMDWISILELFENATPEGIALSSLTPDKKSKEWKVAGRARSFKAVQQYLEKLEASNNFSEILLLSHQNMTAGEAARGVQFAISCKVLNL